jgi:CO dehydrogenase nickel-insertion accessory protein CooC1
MSNTNNLFKKKEKLSLAQLALNITKKNIEKNKAKESLIVVKNKRKKSKKTSNFNLIKQEDGSIICFIPENMHIKFFNMKIEQNIELINNFKENDNNILKI